MYYALTSGLVTVEEKKNPPVETRKVSRTTLDKPTEPGVDDLAAWTCFHETGCTPPLIELITILRIGSL